MSSIPEWWTVPYPEVSSARAATDYLDAIGAALSRYEDGDMYVLATGPQELIRTDTPEELDTFVLGFALAHLICERYGLIGARPGTAQAAEDQPQTETLTAVPDGPAAEEAMVVGDAEADVVPDVPPPDEPASPVQTLTAVADLADDITGEDDEPPMDDETIGNGSAEEPVAQGRAGRRRGRR